MVVIVDGSEVELAEAAAQGLYDGALAGSRWKRRGAVTAAARIRHAIAYGHRSRPLAFDGDEAVAVRAALEAIEGH